MTVGFHFHFHPVGQGLFASGCLYVAHGRHPKFLWVYDCGTVTSQNKISLNKEISELKKFACGKLDIDLLALSHFDEDHISGVVALLGEFKVKTLMLPYASLEQRVAMAFRSGIEPGDERMGYFIDPVQYFRSLAGDRIDNIVFIDYDEGGEANDPEEFYPSFFRKTEDGEKSMDDVHWKLSLPIALAGDQLMQEFGLQYANLNLIQSGMPFILMGVWEFCPYNQEREKLPQRFSQAVASLKKQLLDSDDPKETEKALGNLKNFYDARFGSKPKERNQISLFLYSGPIYKTWQSCRILDQAWTDSRAYPSRYPAYRRVHIDARAHHSNCGMLYGGDGYLDTDDRFQFLFKKLGNIRMERLGVFQVCHHGAKDNWHPGLAQKINAKLNVFSSDPARLNTGHPHAEVRKDFEPHVNQVNIKGSSYYGWLLS